MPVSEIDNIPSIMSAVRMIQPRTILDLGIGFGKYGVLCREVMDIAQGRITKDEWQTRIVGVEGFQKYQNPCWDVYNAVDLMDFTTVKYSEFDLVLLIDSLEHLDFETGKKLVAQLVRDNRFVIVSCPNGNYPQDAVYGNEFERHRSVWIDTELEMRGGQILHRGICTVALFKGKFHE